MRHALIRMSSKSGLHNACRYLYRLAAMPIVVVLVMCFQQARTNAFGVFLPITAELGHPMSVEMTYKFLRANGDDDARYKHCIPKTDSAMANTRKSRLCETSRPADNMQSTCMRPVAETSWPIISKVVAVSPANSDLRRCNHAARRDANACMPNRPQLLPASKQRRQRPLSFHRPLPSGACTAKHMRPAGLSFQKPAPFAGTKICVFTARPLFTGGGVKGAIVRHASAHRSQETFALLKNEKTHY